MKVRVGGAWKDIVAGYIRVGGSWRRLQAIQSYVDGAYRIVATFANPLSLTLSRSSVSKTGTYATVTTAAVLATPTGGQGPFSYAWTKQSGGSIIPTSPANASTTFRASNMVSEESRTAVFRCTCADAFGATDTADVTVTITRTESIDTGGNL